MPNITEPLPYVSLSDAPLADMDSPPLAVAIGVMDGVHKGHQTLLETAAEIARAQNLVAAAVTFDPHPSALFAPHRAPLLLGTLAERAALLRQHGAAQVLVLNFDRALAALTPDAFFHDILRARLNARAVIVGEDFRFGCDRLGTAAYLAEQGTRHDVTVAAISSVSVGGVPARSSVIRQCLFEGNVAQAALLLGRSYAMAGVVGRGKQLGRTIGYPTANLYHAPDLVVPGAGIYAGLAHLETGETWRAAISVGTNPTVGDNNARTVEAFLMDGFEGDLYEQRLVVEFVARLRPMVKFDGLPALVAQMARDVDEAARIVPLRNPNKRKPH